jgi:tetratricopeptide (TPR) repeat protein
LKLAPRNLRSPARKTSDLPAYQLFLQGRYWWNKRPSQGVVRKGIEFFNQAVARDPDFALAHVGLADSYNTLAAWESGEMAPNIAFPMARAAANRALQADANLAEAHTSLGYAEFHFGWDWRRAEEEFRLALSLNPHYAYCRHWYSHFLTAMGKTQEALAESIRIIELDPLDLVMNVHLAWHYYTARQYWETLEQANHTLGMEPAFQWGYFFRGLALEQMQNLGGAVDAFRKSVESSGGSTVMLSALGHAYGAAGDVHQAREVLRTLDATSRQRYISSYEVALIHVALDEYERAFEWFDKAWEERSGWLPYLNVEPRIDCLRGDVRLQMLASRVGLPTSAAVDPGAFRSSV